METKINVAEILKDKSVADDCPYKDKFNKLKK